MRVLKQLFGSQSYSAKDVLRDIWNDYCDHWPDNSVRFSCWKPTSILPAPKWAVIRAAKLCYAEWPEPIDSNVFSTFFMEFADLALHLSQEDYEIIERFRKGRVLCHGKDEAHDPLLIYTLSSSLAPFCSVEECDQCIIRVRDELRRSAEWDPVDADDSELNAVHRIILESTVNFASLIQEWRFYILSIGRDQFPNS